MTKKCSSKKAKKRRSWPGSNRNVIMAGKRSPDMIAR